MEVAMPDRILAARSVLRACRNALVLAPLFIILQAGAAGALPAYNVDTNQVSVSGLSSGAFMAVQLHVAYSATFKAGAGIVAGGPFFCAQGSVFTATGPCMAATAGNKPATAALVSITKRWARDGSIDDTANLAASKVYLYSGTRDSVVRPAVMNEARKYYRHFVNSAGIFYKHDVASEHAMVTDYYGGACAVKGSPYIDNCHFDLAGDMLRWIYGPLAARNDGALGGAFVQFRQSDFIADPTLHGMADNGWLYVPLNCADMQRCKLHVVLHGCHQDTSAIFDQFYRDTGYNKWADTNNIIVLYPQGGSGSLNNPDACWDWWGDDDPDYAKRSGRQMAAIKGMVDRITGAVPPFLCIASTASNYSHVMAGRAHDFFGFAYAVGSNQDMGLDNALIDTTLAQTLPGYYAIGNCP
ncbi:MAG TPA: PHA-depolymerase-like protein [Oxalobacteraceae bacterium]|nr:PHA-depolymerase-like protein [Oxalobacteraceae bacterium]HCN91466.1 PHA-depolymerase-like protein [Oxalobacteraceae bacterium]